MKAISELTRNFMDWNTARRKRFLPHIYVYLSIHIIGDLEEAANSFGLNILRKCHFMLFWGLQQIFWT